MLFNYFFLLPETYLLISIFFIFSYLVFYSFSVENKFPKNNVFISYVVKLILINFFFLSLSFFTFNFGIRDIIYKDDLSNGIQILNIVFVYLFFSSSFSLLVKYSFSTLEFSVLILLSLLSLNFLITSVNLISFYLLLEFQSICFYTLTSFYKKNKYSYEAGLKYFILGSFSSILLLFGIAIIYGATGIFYFEDLNIFLLNIRQLPAIEYLSSIIHFGIALMLVGLLFKLYSFPFHFWVSDIYQGAPFAVTFFFSFVPFISLFYVFVKLYFSIFIFFADSFMLFFFFTSVGSMLIGTLGAIQQKKFRRLIAYSSITSTGYYLMFFIFPDLVMLKNIFFFIFVYLINVFGIFISFASFVFVKEKYNIERFSLLAGYIKYNKLLAFIVVLLFFSIAGLPPFPSFIAKLMLLFTLFNNQLYFFMFLIIITTVLSFYYYLRISKIILYNDNKHWFQIEKISYTSALYLYYVILFNVLLIFKPSLFLNIIEYFLLDLF